MTNSLKPAWAPGLKARIKYRCVVIFLPVWQSDVSTVGYRKCLCRRYTGSSTMDSYLRFQHGSPPHGPPPRHSGLAFPHSGAAPLPSPGAGSPLAAALSPFGGLHRAMAAAGASFPPPPTPPPPAGACVNLPLLPPSQLMTSPFAQSPMSALTLAERLAGMRLNVSANTHL